MAKYVLILFYIVLLYPITGKSSIKYKNKTIKKNNLLYIVLVSIVLIIFSGLRHNNIGIDTINYRNMFVQARLLNFGQSMNLNIEPGYQILQVFFGKIFGNYQLFLIFIATLYVSTISYLIYKFSYNPMFSYLLFLFYDFYIFSMSAIRQTIAIALIVIAFMQIIEKKFFSFLSWTILASSFHITALVFLPAYFSKLFKFNKKNLFLLLFIAIIIFFVKEYLQSTVNVYSRLPSVPIETGGVKLYLLILITVLLGVLYNRNFFINNSANAYLFFMMVLSLIMFPVIRYNPITLRLNYYYYIFMIIYVPNLTKAIKNIAIRNLVFFMYLIIGIYWFISTINTKQIFPYLFFWQ